MYLMNCNVPGNYWQLQDILLTFQHAHAKIQFLITKVCLTL